MPVIRYLLPGSKGDARYCTSSPLFHARLIARNVLFSDAFSASARPDPVIVPAGGTIAAAAGDESKPMPGALSNGATSALAFMLYGVGFAFGSGSGPSSRIFERTFASSGRL